MHHRSDTEEGSPPTVGMTAHHRTGRMPRGDSGLSETPGEARMDDSRQGDHLGLVRRMATEGLTARLDPADRAFAILVRPGPRASLGAGRVRRALLDIAVEAGALHRDRHGVYGVAGLVAGSDRLTAQADVPRVNEAESPLAWLHSRTGADGAKLIDDAAFLAGERFRRDVTQAAMLPSVTTNWARMEAASSRASPRDPAMASDAVIAARQRVRAAFQMLGRDMGHFVLDVCGFLVPLQQAEMQRSWPARSGKLVLKLALARLASHYGISDTATGRSNGRAGDRVLVWHDAPERASMAAWLHAADQDAAAPPP